MPSEESDGRVFDRIMLKLSGEALMGELDYGTDHERVERIAEQVTDVRTGGVEIAIVVGAGNIYRGLQGVAAADVPADEQSAERAVFEQKAAEEGKPENVRERIVEGQLAKWRKEVALLDQPHANVDKHEGKTIEQLRAEASAKTGENIRIARFARFEVGAED